MTMTMSGLTPEAEASRLLSLPKHNTAALGVNVC